MSDQDKSGHWSSLAAGLGATPPADDKVESTDAGEPEGVESAPQADIEEPVVEHSRPRTVRQEGPPTNWSELADNLGVEIPAQAFEPASAQLDTSPPTVDVDEPALPTEEASDQTPLLEESDDRDQVAEEDEDNELAELALDARDDGGFASGVFDDSVDVESDDEETVVVADTDEVDGRETGVDTADTGEPPAEKKPGRRRRRRPRGRKSDDKRTDTPPEPATDEQSDDAVAIVDGESEDTLETSLVADETESASPDSEEPPTKTKRRRRRRRGSGRKTTPTSEDDQSAEKETPESDDTPRRRGRPRDSGDVESEDGQEKEESGKAAKDSHRAIPSWAEAIDVVVSANLENHKKKKPGGASRSRGGRKRGSREKSSDRAK
jgi:hypothetical protein